MTHMFSKLICSYAKETEAATAVEFALIALPFILMIFGAMVGGHTMIAYNGVQYAAEETSRYAAINSELPNTSYQQYAEDKLSELLISGDELDITSTFYTTSGINFVQIDAAYQHQSLLGSFLPGNFGALDWEISVRKPVVE